ncbi:kinase-like domain-containing protein [Aspergillus leporis]|uniref:Kinase-like domain-containing protein n=1 Tax=Aspergillus leporis TaxID=41062 RepID=A0A5N5WGW0_9EURO|nr:kinase-like domain-containing protein [Aspergillus leporis]
MRSTKILGSPIQMSLPRGESPPIQNETPTRSEEATECVKYGNPFTMDRLFIGLEPAWSGINAIEFTEHMPISFVSKLDTTACDKSRIDCLRQTSHRHLVNLKEVFVTEESLLLFYEKWEGISLKEIQDLRPAFQLGEVEVATICYQILQALQYIHNTLGINHGALRDQDIYIHKTGDIKIAKIGESMIRESSPQEKSKDIRATLKIARKLLGLRGASGGRGTMGLLVHDFTAAPFNTTVDQLLQHPLMRFNAGSWCLRPINLLCTIAKR